jgi:hypothetical protein
MKGFSVRGHILLSPAFPDAKTTTNSPSSPVDVSHGVVERAEDDVHPTSPPSQRFDMDTGYDPCKMQISYTK